ncbi:MAG: MFS transporter [Alphaproteobacteria bacterium]|nr:MFS transporter [Alphaproteobacteria bacterium]
MNEGSDPRRLDGVSRRAVAGLAVTQIIGWGTTFHLPAVLGSVMAPSIGVSMEVLFGGISMQLLASALVAPRVGRRIDRMGGRAIMVAGSVLLAVALVLIALAHGPILYFIGWALIGLATPMTLGAGTQASLVQVAGPSARRAVSVLLFFTGLPSFFFWPLASWLEPMIGWRHTTLLFAAMHLLICVPIHLAVLRRRIPVRLSADGTAMEEGLPPRARRGAFWLLATVLAFAGMISWGVALNIIELLKASGLSPTTAVFIATLAAPIQAAARIVEFMFGGRYPATITALVSAAVMPLGFVAMLIGGGSVWAAAMFVACYGVSNGLMTLARATIPLALFGRGEYGTWTGRLTTPQNLIFAASPVVFAALLQRQGPDVMTWAGLAMAVGCLIAMVLLARYARRHR